MKSLKIAVEYERGLHDAATFMVVNRAPDFLYHPLNIEHSLLQKVCTRLQKFLKFPLDAEKGETKYFHEEGTLHQDEFNSLPASSLDELCADFLKAEEISDHICKELGAVNIPISENGAGRAKINPGVQHRIYGYEAVFGKEAVERLIKISGIHLHLDQYKPRLGDQFNALTALRPIIALTSTSPISHQGENSANCHRYKIFADPNYGVFAAVPEEIKYISRIEDLMARDKRRHETWVKRFEAGKGAS